MKKYVLMMMVIPIAVISLFTQVHAQDASVAETAISSMDYQKVRTLSLFAPTTLLTIQQNRNNNWKTGTNLSIGNSYVVRYGSETKVAGDLKVSSPSFYGGLTLLFGVTALDGQDDPYNESFIIGGIAGINNFSGILGYDFFLDSFVFGMGFQFDHLTPQEQRTWITGAAMPVMKTGKLAAEGIKYLFDLPNKIIHSVN